MGRGEKKKKKDHLKAPIQLEFTKCQALATVEKSIVVLASGTNVSPLLLEALPPLLRGWISKQQTSCPFMRTASVPALVLKCPPVSLPLETSLRKAGILGHWDGGGFINQKRGFVHSSGAAKNSSRYRIESLRRLFTKCCKISNPKR